VCRDDRSVLEWHRRLLQAGKQGLARLRRGPQQQDPRHPAPRLRSTRPGISPAQGAHMHASSPLKLPKTPTRLPEDPKFFPRFRSSFRRAAPPCARLRNPTHHFCLRLQRRRSPPPSFGSCQWAAPACNGPHPCKILQVSFSRNDSDLISVDAIGKDANSCLAYSCASIVDQRLTNDTQQPNKNKRD